MRMYVSAFFCFLTIPLMASCPVENASDVAQKTSTPLEGIIAPKAREWAELCLACLSAQDRVMVCTLLGISYQFSDADLKLKKAVRTIFDECCLIQDKAQRFIGITEDTEYLKQMALEVDIQVKAYNANLEGWSRYVDMVNNENNEGVLNALHEADSFTTVYIDAFLQLDKNSLCHEFNNAIAANLRQSEMVRTISLSIVDSLRSLKDGAKSFNEVMDSSFELARIHFCNEVKSILIMRELFEIQEELLGLRKAVAYVFYEAALPYCDVANLG